MDKDKTKDAIKSRIIKRVAKRNPKKVTGKNPKKVSKDNSENVDSKHFHSENVSVSKKHDSICQFIYQRPIHEKEFSDYINNSSRMKSETNIFSFRKKNEICGRPLQNGKKHCCLHTGILIDFDPFFKDFVDWVETDPVVTWGDLNYNRQRNLFRAFKGVLKNIELFRNHFGIEKDQVDLSDEKFIEIEEQGDKKEKEKLKRYYELYTIDLRQAFLKMGCRKFEKKYKDHFNEWPFESKQI